MVGGLLIPRGCAEPREGARRGGERPPQPCRVSVLWTSHPPSQCDQAKRAAGNGPPVAETSLP